LQKLIFLLAFIGTCHSSLAQLSEAMIKQYLATPKFEIDTEASAVVLCERTDVEIYIENDRYRISKKVHQTIKIFKKDAFNLANLHFQFHKDGYANCRFTVAGAAYNLEGGDVKETSIPGDDLYKTKLSNDYVELSTAIPGVKEGCVIDFTYNLSTPFYYALPAWAIQEKYPKLKSEYSSAYPRQTEFVPVLQSQFTPREFKNEEEAVASPEKFGHLSSTKGFSFGNYSAYWVRKDVPGIQNEPLVWNMRKYLERMEFQLLKFMSKEALFMSSWKKYSYDMWKEELATDVRRPNKFLSDTVSSLVQNDTAQLSMAKKIYSYVRANFDDESHSVAQLTRKGNGYTGIKKTFYNRGGNTADINALLVAMLNNAGLEAYILATSSTSQFPASPLYPVENGLNYYACALIINHNYILLDASDKNNSFGWLPFRHYNGYARVISENGAALNFGPAIFEDANTASINITMADDSTHRVECTKKIGRIASIHIRKAIAANEYTLNSFIEKYVEKAEANATIIERSMYNLNNPDTNLILKVVYTAPINKAANGYLFNTSYPKLFSKNPLVAATRAFPIEFPYRSNDSYQLTVALPKGYTVAVVPQPTTISLGENGMLYQKATTYNPETNTLSVNTTYKNKTVTYDKGDYGGLKEFYDGVLKDENQIIEFTRKN
jgi:hypothetical protein